MKRLSGRLAPLLSALALAVGCAGPPIPAPIEGEPVCPDVEIGTTRGPRTKMQGGMRFPVQLRILDGKTVLYRTVIKGLRRPDDKKTHTFIADDSHEYTVEWGQCANERAPRPVATSAKEAKDKDKEAHTYECGEATIYKTDKLVTKKGDKASHALTFLPPPNATCWAGEAAAAPSVADAGAPPADAAAPAIADADASAPAPDAGATDASAPAADAGATATDAGSDKPKK